MKTKRKRKVKSAVRDPAKPEIKQCWYCDFTADAGAEAEIRLSKPDDRFDYLNSDPENIKYVYSKVRIARCAECQVAHDKIDSVHALLFLLCLIGCGMLAVYFGIYEKPSSRLFFAANVLVVLGSTVGAAWIGLKYNFFMLPKNTKKLEDVEAEPQVKALRSKGWRLAR